VRSPEELLAGQARFWALIRRGSTHTAACEAAGVDRRQGYRWRRAAGGRIPRAPRVVSGRYLSLQERLRLGDLRLAGMSQAGIAAELGRSPATISRELTRGRSAGATRPARAPGGSYAPYAAHQRAGVRARRSRVRKLEHPELRSFVETRLMLRWSPAQISQELGRAHPDQPEMQVSHETIYQALFVQGRGQLRADLHRQLRTGRAVRRPRGPVGRSRPPRVPGMISISERPAEAADRAVPGHWEGDLILGSNCRSAIATLVERSTRYVVLVHLPGGAHDAFTVATALTATIHTLPGQLRRSLTWDQGTELARHRAITLATDLDIYFCDPHSPWQRGSNENTNGLLRQYFPKGSDLSQHTPERLTAVAAELNGRPRKTLGWAKPAEAMNRLLQDSNPSVVATTT